jgi:hypothetical protein
VVDDACPWCRKQHNAPTTSNVVSTAHPPRQMWSAQCTPHVICGQHNAPPTSYAAKFPTGRQHKRENGPCKLPRSGPFFGCHANVTVDEQSGIVGDRTISSRLVEHHAVPTDLWGSRRKLKWKGSPAIVFVDHANVHASTSRTMCSPDRWMYL